MTTVMFTIPGHPRGKQRPRVVRRGSFVSTYTPDETTSYEAKVATFYRQNGGAPAAPFDGPVSLAITCRMQLPSSWSEKKRRSAEGRPCTKKPDADNVAKIVADALNGIAWTDDSRIAALSVRKAWDMTPGLDVLIRFHGEGEQIPMDIQA